VATDNHTTKYKRVLLKLSGEALLGAADSASNLYNVDTAIGIVAYNGRAIGDSDWWW
jgi:uridylate kinase